MGLLFYNILKKSNEVETETVSNIYTHSAPAVLTEQRLSHVVELLQLLFGGLRSRSY